MKRKLRLKREKNQLASQFAVREENCIYYDEKYPLIVNDQIKIEKIYVKKEEGEEEPKTSFKSLMPRTVRLEFVEKDEAMKNRPFVMDLYTSLSLEDLEKRLKRCKTEQEIEDII